MRIILKTLATLVTLVVSLLPLWFFLLLKSALNPEGFWEKFILFGAGLYFLGLLQIILLVLAVAFSLGTIWDD